MDRRNFAQKTFGLLAALPLVPLFFKENPTVESDTSAWLAAEYLCFTVVGRFKFNDPSCYGRGWFGTGPELKLTQRRGDLHYGKPVHIHRFIVRPLVLGNETFRHLLVFDLKKVRAALEGPGRGAAEYYIYHEFLRQFPAEHLSDLIYTGTPPV